MGIFIGRKYFKSTVLNVSERKGYVCVCVFLYTSIKIKRQFVIVLLRR